MYLRVCASRACVWVLRRTRVHHGDTAVGIELDQPARMHAEPRAGRHLPLLRADHGVDAGRVAHRERAQFGGERLARPLQLVAGLFVERPAGLRHRARHAGRHAAFAQHAAHAEGAVGKAARRVKVDRQVRVALAREKRAQPGRGSGVERALGGDPLAAARAARVGAAFGDIEDHRRLEDFQDARGDRTRLRERRATRQDRRGESKEQRFERKAHGDDVAVTKTPQPCRNASKLHVRAPWAAADEQGRCYVRELRGGCERCGNGSTFSRSAQSFLRLVSAAGRPPVEKSIVSGLRSAAGE